MRLQSSVQRRDVVVRLSLLVGACALPPNSSLTDWARTASVVVDRPALLPPDDRAAAAWQQAISVYLYALSVLGEIEQPLRFRPDSFVAISAVAGPPGSPPAEAAAAIGRALGAAYAANFRPGARADSAYPAPLVQDNRLPAFVRAGDVPLRVLIDALAAGLQPGAYRSSLTSIAEDHALIAASAAHITQRELARSLQAAEDRLRRSARLLPPDPIVLARAAGDGAVAKTVQP
jgi:hypothetical protein